MRPQVGTSDGKPNPRNERVDSKMIDAPTARVVATMIGLRTFGRMCLNINEWRLAPIERAESINSFSLSDRKLARTTRAVGIQLSTEMTVTIKTKMPRLLLLNQLSNLVINESLNRYVISRSSGTVGRLMNMSVIRINRLSANPPKNPAVAPMSVPSEIEMSAASKPTTSEMRPPQSNRASMS